MHGSPNATRSKSHPHSQKSIHQMPLDKDTQFKRKLNSSSGTSLLGAKACRGSTKSSLITYWITAPTQKLKPMGLGPTMYINYSLSLLLVSRCGTQSSHVKSQPVLIKIFL
ncbi:hypothetical protein SO802_023827 [Lithocarpus litseifolius]|uniref:Uncharacterized protein n=1 Tax=Lithocarpus litseifolius TaxID=425828 RepID=A0AAW2CAG0_9ROSI